MAGSVVNGFADATDHGCYHVADTIGTPPASVAGGCDYLECRRRGGAVRPSRTEFEVILGDYS